MFKKYATRHTKSRSPFLSAVAATVAIALALAGCNPQGVDESMGPEDPPVGAANADDRLQEVLRAFEALPPAARERQWQSLLDTEGLGPIVEVIAVELTGCDPLDVDCLTVTPLPDIDLKNWHKGQFGSIVATTTLEMDLDLGLAAGDFYRWGTAVIADSENLTASLDRNWDNTPVGPKTDSGDQPWSAPSPTCSVCIYGAIIALALIVIVIGVLWVMAEYGYELPEVEFDGEVEMIVNAAAGVKKLIECLTEDFVECNGK